MKIHNVQQRTVEWDEIRKWKITWTRLKQVMGSPTVQKGLILDLISEVLAPPQEKFENDAMRRGIELEEDAKRKYEEISWNKIEEIGICTHDEKEYLGLSPDGVIKKDWKYQKAIEIKCMRPHNHLKCILENKVPTEYKWQVVHYFIVNEELEELDFIVYNPDIYLPSLNVKIINIKREDIQEDIKKAIEQIDKFVIKWQESINLLTKEQWIKSY